MFFFQIIDKLGVGGCGIVYKVERVHTEPKETLTESISSDFTESILSGSDWDDTTRTFSSSLMSTNSEEEDEEEYLSNSASLKDGAMMNKSLSLISGLTLSDENLYERMQAGLVIDTNKENETPQQEKKYHWMAAMKAETIDLENNHTETLRIEVFNLF